MGKRIFRLSYEDRLLFCFLGGVIGGTIIANLLCTEMQSQVGYFDAWLTAGRELDGAARQRLWHYVLQQRMPEFLGIWLVSLTVFSAVGFDILMALAGVGVGVSVSVLTMQKGMIGILLYPATIFPQALCYVPVWLYLAYRAGESRRSLQIPGVVVLGVVWLLGTFLEVYVNPFLIVFF